MPPTNAPTLDEFMDAARVTSPGVPDRDLKRYWAKTYSGIDPATLPTYQTFLPKARERNPDMPESTLRQYWDEHYGDFGAAETDPKPLGLGGTLLEGAKSAGRSLKAAGQALIGDESGVVDTARAQQAAEKDPALRDLLNDIQRRKASLGEDPSWMASLAETGKAALSNPKGAFYLLAEQTPNSAVALGAAGAGALAGSTLGPVGTIAGGLAGLFGANVALETGAKAVEAGSDQTFTPDERSRVLKEGAIKGSVVTAIDAASMGLSNWITGTTARAVERATAKTLTDAGVNLADREAVLAATKNPDIFTAVQQAQQRAVQASTTLGQRLSRGAGALGTEAIGEGAGEYLGEYAATGQADKVEAIIEAFAGLGQSAGEITLTQMRNRGRQEHTLLTGQAPTALPDPEQKIESPQITAVPAAVGLGDPNVGIDEAVQASWDLLETDRIAQEQNAKASQKQAEQQLTQGPEPSLTIPRVGQEIPILAGPEPTAPITTPVESPSSLWMDEAVTVDPTIERGAAFTPRAERSPEARERIQAERERLLAMRRPSGATPAEPVTTPPPEPDAEPVPLQSAVDLAYPPSERGRMPTQQELVARGRMLQKRAAEVPTMIEAPKTSPAQSPVVPASPFTPRQERELTPRERIAQERERLLAMRNRSMPSQPASAPPVEPGPSSPPPQGRPTPQPEAAIPPTPQPTPTIKPDAITSDMREALDAGYSLDVPDNTAEVTRLTAKAKKLTKREFLGTLSKAERKVIQATGFTPEDFWRNHVTGKPIDETQGSERIQETPPTETQAPVAAESQAIPETQPVTPVEEPPKTVAAPQPKVDAHPHEVPRSTLPPEENAVMLLPAEKAQADMEIAGGERGGRYFMETQGQGGTMEVRGLKSPTADWYKELTKGPGKLSRKQIETAIQKIIQDHGVDIGTAVERVKQALLQHHEFRKTPWGEDADSIMQGEWPSWIPRPDEAQAETAKQDGETSLDIPPDDIALADIPDGLTVDVTAIRQATGDEMTVKENAKEALERIDASLAKYTKLLECLGA